MRFFISNPKFFAKISLLAVFLCLSLTLNFVSCGKAPENASETTLAESFNLTPLSDTQSLDISAKSAIAIEVSSGEIYFEKNAYGK